ncbi:unnamed protein product, partial [Owenia fusiformis]
AGTMSEPFKIRQGVFQGAVNSMILYQFYISDLLTELQRSNLGAKVMGMNTCSPAYADDIALVALFPGAMDTLLDISFKHSSKWRYTLHPQKCVALTYGSNEKYAFNLGTDTIKNVTKAKHVGIPLSTTGDFSDHTKHAISSGKRKLFTLFGLGHKTNGLSPILATKLYNSFTVPTFLYGDQIINYKQRDVEMMEVAQREIGRRIQFLPSNCSNPMSTMPLGMCSVKLKMDYDKLLMFFSIITLPMTNIYKQLLMMRFMSIFIQGKKWDSPIYRMWECIKRHNLLDYVINMITNANFPSKYTWKRIIRNIIGTKQRNDYNTICAMYKRHDIGVKISDVSTNRSGLLKPCIWWLLAKMKPENLPVCKIMMRLSTDCHELRVKNSGLNCICVLCNTFEVETIEHFLSSCEAYFDEHARLTSIINKYGNPCDLKSVVFGYHEHITENDMIQIGEIVLQMSIKRARLMRAYTGNQM